MFKIFKGCCGKSDVKKSIKRKSKKEGKIRRSMKCSKGKKEENNKAVNCAICLESFDKHKHKFIQAQCDKALEAINEELKREELKGEEQEHEAIAVIYQKNSEDVEEDEENNRLSCQDKFNKNRSLDLYTIKQTDLTQSNDKVLENMETDGVAILVECKHVFHNTCINSWLKQNNTCPICRKEIYPTNDHSFLRAALLELLAINLLNEDSDLQAIQIGFIPDSQPSSSALSPQSSSFDFTPDIPSISSYLSLPSPPSHSTPPSQSFSIDPYSLSSDLSS
ncbi:unnamed protein product [Moneuplotes crassus]|uniref:RING-type domain-containing protein n=1 Tax=Euplotes crassus TaxID=5936 RepID=A0AAD2CZD4_EUPCR|nr:unnamed protein product [Moneuplotes crassus]